MMKTVATKLRKIKQKETRLLKSLALLSVIGCFFWRLVGGVRFKSSLHDMYARFTLLLGIKPTLLCSFFNLSGLRLVLPTLI